MHQHAQQQLNRFGSSSSSSTITNLQKFILSARYTCTDHTHMHMCVHTHTHTPARIPKGTIIDHPKGRTERVTEAKKSYPTTIHATVCIEKLVSWLMIKYPSTHMCAQEGVFMLKFSEHGQHALRAETER